MALRKIVAVLCILALVAPAPLARAQAPRQTPPTQPPSERGYNHLQAAARYQSALRTALKIGDVDSAYELMTRDPHAAVEVVERMRDPSGKVAETFYRARRRVADRIMEEVVRDPALRGKIISVEIGGTAGMEGPGFNPRTADIDFQFRGVDAESARLAKQRADEKLKAAGVPQSWKINPFPANADGTPIPASWDAAAESQLTQVKLAQERLSNPEASVGDANEAVRADYYERGSARVVLPNNRLSNEISVDMLYELKKWAPPEVTKGGAFGVAVNEQVKFESLHSDAKRVFRSADALQRVDPAALTEADRRVVELSRELYETRDPVRAIEALGPQHPLYREYDRQRRLLKSDVKAAEAVVDLQNNRARLLLEKSTVRTLQAKLDDFNRTLNKSPEDFILEQRTRAAAGDSQAQAWLKDLANVESLKDPVARVRRIERLVNIAKEGLANAKQWTLIEELNALPTEARNRLVRHPDFAGNETLRRSALVSMVMTGTTPAGSVLRQANEFMRLDLDPGSPGGAVLHHGGTLLMLLAVTGALTDIYNATDAAYQAGGRAAAAQACAVAIERNVKQLTFGIALTVFVQSLGYLAEGAGYLARGTTGVGLVAVTVRDLGNAAKALANAGWRCLQDPLLSGMVDPESGSSFYAHMGWQADELASSFIDYAHAHGLNPFNKELVVRTAVEAYLKDLPGVGRNMEGMAERLVDALVWEWEQTDKQLYAIATALNAGDPLKAVGNLDLVGDRTPDTPLANPLDIVKLEQAEAERLRASEQARALEDKAKADAEEVERLARKQRQKKDEEERAKKAAEEKKKADEEALKKQQEPPPSTPPSTQQSRLDQLRAQKEEEDRLRAEEEAEARRAAEERAAEERRRQQEAVLLEQVRVRLRVPASLQAGGQGSIEVGVVAPQGLSLAGRYVTVVVSPGHTDERAVRINSSGYGSTVYTAPAGYDGYVRVQASLDGYGGASRTFPVGKVVTPPPADTPPVTPKPVPRTQVPSTPVPSTPELSPAGLPMGDFVVTLSGDEGLSGSLEVRGGRASGRITGPMSGEGVSGSQELTWTAGTYNPSSGLTQGSATYKKSFRIQQAGMNGSVTATSRVDLRLQLRAGGPARVEFTIREVGNVQTSGDIEASSLDGPGDVYGFEARWRLTSR